MENKGCHGGCCKDAEYIIQWPNDFQIFIPLSSMKIVSQCGGIVM